MRVLQLGSKDWSKQYSVPKDTDWHFNDFPEPIVIGKNGKVKPTKRYDVVILTNKTNLKTEDWDKLQWLVDPYHVLYLPQVENIISERARKFLVCQAAERITEDPQILINHLQIRYFFGQSGIRIFPDQLSLNESKVSQFEYQDSGHVKLKINAPGQWVNIGSYRRSLMLDPNRLIKLWLEFQAKNVQLRFRIFIQPNGSDGDPKDNKVITLEYSSLKEVIIPVDPSNDARFACISLEARGQGDLVLGVLHSRWSREGKGAFIAGGQRLINANKREDIGCFFNPGDMKPPLNVYFSGARGLEGFEAYPLFRNLHAPSLLFTDMRLSIGQFYDDAEGSMGRKIKDKILDVLDRLHFDRSQLIMNGISMGTYPAMKYGAQLGAYMINVAKPLGDLGYIAYRSRLQRPDEFDTIFDIDHQILDQDVQLDKLKQLDERFWQEFNNADLSKTRLFVGYMKNDDYDNHAIDKLKESPAVKKALQFSYKGYGGRHNADPTVNTWFIGRLTQVLKDDFGRK